MSRIKAVIFDMDGVLIEAKDWHYDALNQAIRLFGMEISRYDHLVTYDGLPTRKKLEMLSMERGLPRQLHEFINEMKQIYTLEIAFAKCRPVFHHQFALAQLRKTGYKMAVCSNSVRQTIDLMLERADLARFMEFWLSNEDVSQSKPHPEIYQKAIARFGLAPEECLIVEDNVNGIKAARASGAHLLQVRDTHDVNHENITARIAAIEAEHA
jgi:HAD superfamily hydrolase (TIGR01509 family)